MQQNVDHARFRSLAMGGSSVAIDSAMARRAFAEGPLLRLQFITGEALTFEYSVTFVTFWLAPITNLASLFLGSSIFNGVAATVLLVAYWFFWHIDWRRDSFRGWETAILLSVLVGLVAFVFRSPSLQVLWLILCVASLLFARVSSRLANMFFRQLLLRNPTAYEAFREGIRINDDASCQMKER